MSTKLGLGTQTRYENLNGGWVEIVQHSMINTRWVTLSQQVHETS